MNTGRNQGDSRGLNSIKPALASVAAGRNLDFALEARKDYRAYRWVIGYQKGSFGNFLNYLVYKSPCLSRHIPLGRSGPELRSGHGVKYNNNNNNNSFTRAAG